jgi:head-tail adaptor
MAGEFSGRLRQRIQLQQADASVPLAWAPVCQAWAALSPEDRGTLSALDGDTRVTARRWRILLRSETRVSLDMRVLWRGHDLRVTGVQADPDAPDRTVVLAEEVGR